MTIQNNQSLLHTKQIKSKCIYVYSVALGLGLANLNLTLIVEFGTAVWSFAEVGRSSAKNAQSYILTTKMM